MFEKQTSLLLRTTVRDSISYTHYHVIMLFHLRDKPPLKTPVEAHENLVDSQNLMEAHKNLIESHDTS